MSLTLILTRHAKSSWDDPTQDDFDRTLNARGRVSAPAIGNWLVQQGHLPESVVVSGARRTVETWERMAASMPNTATMRADTALYHASAQSILGVLRGEEKPNVMLIGHNPGICEFANCMASSPPDHPRFADYPTAATTVMSFDCADWSEVDWGKGAVLDFAVPRDLVS